MLYIQKYISPQPFSVEKDELFKLNNNKQDQRVTSYEIMMYFRVHWEMQSHCCRVSWSMLTTYPRTARNVIIIRNTFKKDTEYKIFKRLNPMRATVMGWNSSQTFFSESYIKYFIWQRIYKKYGIIWKLSETYMRQGH